MENEAQQRENINMEREKKEKNAIMNIWIICYKNVFILLI